MGLFVAIVSFGLHIQDMEKKSLFFKVYLVVLPRNTAQGGEPNRIILAAKLTHSAAQAIVDQVPGAYIDKQFADKQLPSETEIAELLRKGNSHGSDSSH